MRLPVDWKIACLPRSTRQPNKPALGQRTWRLAPLYLAAGLVLCFICGAAAADEPIDIEADQAEFDERSGTSIFQGDVRLQRGTLSITADKITLYRVNKRLERTVAEGHPAHYSQKLDKGGDIRAEAEKIEYFAATEELHMTGKARLWHEKNRFIGERIIYHITSNRVLANGSGGDKRVRATIYPDENP